MAKVKDLLSIICPTLNEASRLPLLLADINNYLTDVDVHIVDGGSKDKTRLIALLSGAKLHELNTANRGYQLNFGASEANSKWLLFLHSDSRLSKNCSNKIERIINTPSSEKYGWFFNFRITGNRLDMRLLEIAVNLRSIFLQRPYGDQGLLITKKLYDQIGGFNDLHIMEDLDLVIRLSKTTKLKSIGLPLYTDNKKWIKVNVIKQSLANASLRARWNKGECSKLLAEEYYKR